MLRTAAPRVAAATKPSNSNWQSAQPGLDLAVLRKRSSCKDRPGLYNARQQALTKHLGTAYRIQTGGAGGAHARVYSAQSSLTADDKAECMRWAGQALATIPGHQDELGRKRHTQLQLQPLLSTSAGSQLVALFQNQALLPFISAGMHVAAFEVVFSQHNIEPKPCYKGYYIKNKLKCQHQDLRDAEPWFDRAPYCDLPGSLRLVFDISPAGQRWFEFRLLRCGPEGMWLDEQPLLQVCSDLVAFDAPAAGSRGFYSPGGSRIFHARRSSSPGELGVSVVADLVVSAGLGSASSAPYSHTAAFRHFHW